MSVVIDASVALKWVIEEDGSHAAYALQAETLTAPAILLAEAGNALWRHVRLGEISVDEAIERFGALRQAAVRTTSISEDADEALHLATRLSHPIYDCLYLAAAIRQDLVVVTADARFVRAAKAGGLANRVRLLGAN